MRDQNGTYNATIPIYFARTQFVRTPSAAPKMHAMELWGV